MTEQEVTYTTVRFHKSSVFQNEVRSEETQSAKEIGHRESSVPWKLIVIALGILCSVLLVTVAVLVTNIFQYSQEKHELQETLSNLHHNYSTMQNDINLKEEMLRDMSTEYSAVNHFLDFLNREQNRWYNKTKTLLDSLQHSGRGVETHWFCYGIKCYYFIMDRKTWSGCTQTCQNYSLPLLTIDDEDELMFLHLLVTPDSYWIGLSYDNTNGDWTWIDKNPSELALNTRKYNIKDGGCVFLSKTRLDNINCDNLFSCICGKRLDKFPD
ncbi:T-cell surface glycoprotein YE1/48-like isoform X1 [Rattus rattus]|uniref:T-cell surface glycoprotein YE1/48-like isoform X1 n=1 Tax=Rattus rattus TaxID=10117 RepID=UPI0013F37031|nr:T-cell surface glycoprotein YE1/48-like isoform X1 [Rattus rattus]